MSITYHGEDTSSPRSAKTNKSGVTTSTITYLFTTDTRVSEFDIGTHGSCPVIGSTHPDNPAMWCVEVMIANHEPWKGWQVTAEYSSEREITEDPTDEPVRVSWSTEQFQEVAIVDENGDAVCNSAGDPFDPPVMKDFSRRVASVSVNVSSVPSWFLDYEDAVNSDTFTLAGFSVAAGKAKCQRVSVSEEKERNGISYFEVHMEIHLSKNGWLVKPLDAGFRRIYSGTSREKITMTNEAGEEEYPAAPVPLDGSGVELLDPTPATAVYRSFTVYESLPFSALPLT